MTDLLTTEDVAARYLMERHAAARLMKTLPTLRVGKRLFVRACDLTEWERKRTDYPVRRSAGCLRTNAR